MLKGYRMLDAMCPVCSAVLLQTPISEGGMKYCVGCMEVDIGKSGSSSAFQICSACVTTQSDVAFAPDDF